MKLVLPGERRCVGVVAPFVGAGIEISLVVSPPIWIVVAPFVGAGIEILSRYRTGLILSMSPPSWGRELKYLCGAGKDRFAESPPSWGRELK